MAQQRRRTAWTSPQELSVVFSSLFHSDGDSGAQRWAIARVRPTFLGARAPHVGRAADPALWMQIKVWLARGPNCPHAVESTASLLEIVLRDTAAVGSSQRPSQQELRLAYSMALIRYDKSRCWSEEGADPRSQVRQLARRPAPDDLLRTVHGIARGSARPSPLVRRAPTRRDARGPSWTVCPARREPPGVCFPICVRGRH